MRVNNIFYATLNRIFFIAIFILLTGSVTEIKAQNFKSSFNFLLGFPQGEFKENIDNIGLGLSGTFGYHYSQSPVMLGFEASFLIYGRDTRKERFGTSSVPIKPINVTHTNWFVNGILLLRIQPRLGRVQPYFDGLVGLSYLFTETSIKSEGNFTNPIKTSTQQSDYPLNYGAGGGIKIMVWERAKENRKNKRELDEVSIDLRLRYLFGSKVKYLKEGSISSDNGYVSYDLYKLRTNLLIAQIGVAMSF